MNATLEILELAKAMEYNEKGEAQAIYDYTELLKQIEQTKLDDMSKKEVRDVINELISDELNHQQKLQQLFVKLTGIKPNKN